MNLHTPTHYAWIALWQKMRFSEIVKSAGIGKDLLRKAKISTDDVIDILMELDSEFERIKAEKDGRGR